MNSVRDVLVRPKMYTIGGSVGEIYAFLTGYVSGLSAHRPTPLEDIVGEWTYFNDWLHKKLQCGRQDTFNAFVSKFGNGESSAKKLLEMYEEYVADR